MLKTRGGPLVSSSRCAAVPVRVEAFWVQPPFKLIVGVVMQVVPTLWATRNRQRVANAGGEIGASR